ncbi:MAG TPA: hypothetical protein VFO99_01265 [Pyrinomonadaceae bacterium]|nr:hypothetical protein [Pyrinomonadaceae bacterium]
MAEERTLGLARAQETAEEPSKEELQRRLDVTRDSISQTVTEIKETVANQVQAVRNSLDWREQFKKRPVVWSAGALGVGFLVGYSVAAAFKEDDDEYYRYSSAIDRYAEESKSYAAQPVLGAASAGMSSAAMSGSGVASRTGNGSKDHGPGFFERVTNTTAYERVRDEAGNLGNAFVQELSNTAKTVVLPALITSLRNFIGGHLPNAPQSGAQAGSHPPQSVHTQSKYEPSLDH